MFPRERSLLLLILLFTLLAPCARPQKWEATDEFVFVGPEAAPLPPSPIYKELVPFNCVLDPARDRMCRHIALHKVHKTGSGTLFTIMLLHAISRNLSVDPGRWRDGETAQQQYDFSLDHLPPKKFAGWTDIRDYYTERVKPPYRFVVTIREPLARFFSHVHFTNRGDFNRKNKTSDLILEYADRISNYVTKYYFGARSAENVLELIRSKDFERMMFVPSEYFDAGLVLVARTCGWAIECMAYTKTHNMGSDYLHRNITKAVLRHVEQSISLDMVIYKAAMKQFERRLRDLAAWTDVPGSLKCLNEMNQCFERVSCPEFQKNANGSKKKMRASRFCSFFNAGDGVRLEKLDPEGRWTGSRVDHLWLMAITYCSTRAPACKEMENPPAPALPTGASVFIEDEASGSSFDVAVDPKLLEGLMGAEAIEESRAAVNELLAEDAPGEGGKKGKKGKGKKGRGRRRA